MPEMYTRVDPLAAMHQFGLATCIKCLDPDPDHRGIEGSWLGLPVISSVHTWDSLIVTIVANDVLVRFSMGGKTSNRCNVVNTMELVNANTEGGNLALQPPLYPIVS